jgi:hypothetical protein
MQSDRKRQSSEKGFALVTALMACAILFAIAMLIIQLSTGDLRVSSRSVGDKKASSAAEAGIHRLMQNFPANSPATNVQVNAAADPNSRYSIGNVVPGPPPLCRQRPGFGSPWGDDCFVGRVTGVNASYNSSVTIDVGIGSFGDCGSTGYR